MVGNKSQVFGDFIGAARDIHGREVI